MTHYEIYSKISKLKSNRKYRRDHSFTNFRIKTNRSGRLLNKIYKKIDDKTCLKEALCQFVISDITAFEVYFRDIFLAMFSFCKNDKELLSRCTKLIDKNFNIEDLVIINSDEIGIPLLILGFQNFQNLKNIEKVFSTITQQKIFELLDTNEFYKGKPEGYDSHPLDKNWYSKLEEYLELRHNLTHDFNPRLKIELDRVVELHENLLAFIIAMDICLEWNFIQENFRTDAFPEGKRRY
ncbi:MAG: HEPN domain-containing protein [Methanoregula sp.]|jgi:hypothetical protein|uniref:HEPN domain-containing protein n=1 Tax=Methanoregula sp. TaxID=2052170 RepID=UPI003D1525EB